MGKPPTKSMETLSHDLFGTRNNMYNQIFLLIGLLVLQRTRPIKNLSTFSYIFVLYIYLYKFDIVFIMQKCLAILEVCYSLIN
jgi:hypothetical protein